MNLRGEVLPIIDLRKRFNLDKATIDDFTRIIVTDINGKRTGFIVDYVEGVEKIPDSYIEGLGETLDIGETKRFISNVARINDKLILILDIEDIFLEKEEIQLEKVASKAKQKKTKTTKAKKNGASKKLKRSK